MVSSPPTPAVIATFRARVQEMPGHVWLVFNEPEHPLVPITATPPATVTPTPGTPPVTPTQLEHRRQEHRLLPIAGFCSVQQRDALTQMDSLRVSRQSHLHQTLLQGRQSRQLWQRGPQKNMLESILSSKMKTLRLASSAVVNIMLIQPTGGQRSWRGLSNSKPPIHHSALMEFICTLTHIRIVHNCVILRSYRMCSCA